MLVNIKREPSSENEGTELERAMRKDFFFASVLPWLSGFSTATVGTKEEVF